MYAAMRFGAEVGTSFAARRPALEKRERRPGRLVSTKIGSGVGVEVLL